MNPDLMRLIDKFAGIPLTFACTVLMKTTRLIKPPAPRPPKRILFIELSEMGSTILADPAMRLARKQFNAELYFAIFKGNRQSLLLLNTVPEENIFTFRENNLFTLALDTLIFRFWSRRNSIDTVIDLELFSRFTALMTWYCGAVNAVGFYAFHNDGLYRGDFLSHKVSYNPYLHISKNFVSLVRSLLTEKKQLPYTKCLIDDNDITLEQYKATEAEIEKVLTTIASCYPSFNRQSDRLMLINPNSSKLLPQRCWMAENYIVLIKMILAADPGAVVLVTGAPGEEQGSDDIVKQVDNPKCVSVTGRFKLTELPALYTVATLMVTNDSGPGHFSAITSLPTFIIFGPETPALYGSLGKNATPIYLQLACSPCVSAANHRKTPCLDNVCLQMITPEMVFEKVKHVLLGRDS